MKANTPEDNRRDSHGVVHFDPRRAAWLESRGYLRSAGPGDDPERQIFHRSEARENARRTDGPQGQVLYEKRQRGLKLWDAWETRLAVGRKGSVLLREWAALRRALACSLVVPQPWAVGETRGWLAPRAGFLLVEELSGRALDETLAETDSLTFEQRQRLATEVGRHVARLHDSGLVFAELQAKHIWVIDEDTLEIGFLDLASVSFKDDPSLRLRARDLGVLAASLPHVHASSVLRLRMLRAYVAAMRSPCPLRPLLEAATLAAADRFRLRRFRKNLATVRGPSEPSPRTRSSRASEPETRYQDLAFSLWRLFGVTSATSAGLRSLATELEETGSSQDLEQDLLDLLLRAFRSGVLPEPGFLDHVRITEPGTLVVHHTAPFNMPRRMRPRHVRRSIIFLARALRAMRMPRESRTRLVRALRREAPRTALVTPRGHRK